MRTGRYLITLSFLLLAFTAHSARPGKAPPSISGLKLGLVLIVEDNLYHSHQGMTAFGNQGPKRRMPLDAAATVNAEATRILTAAGIVVRPVELSTVLRAPFRETNQRDARKALQRVRPQMQALMHQQGLDELLVLSTQRNADSIFFGMVTDISAQGLMTLRRMRHDVVIPYALLFADRITVQVKDLKRVSSADCARGVPEKLPTGLRGLELPDDVILPLRDAVLDHVRMATSKVLHASKLTWRTPRCSGLHG